MRTALVLLFLLAVAAIPGSVLPQRDVSIEKVQRLLRATHPDLGARGWTGSASSTCTPRPGSPRSTCCCSSRWSAASCRGCATTPRAARRAAGRAGAAGPAAAARRRWPATATRRRPRGDRGGCCARRRWRRARCRRRRHGRRAEKGYLKETGNLLFHFALLGDAGRGRRSAPGTAGTATGSWSPAPDTAFCNTLPAVRRVRRSAPRVDAADLPPFCLTLDDFQARVPRQRAAGVRSRPTVTVRGATGRPATAGVHGQRPAAARRRQRLPARPRLRAGAALHRPVRRSADQRSRRSCPVDGNADQRGRGDVPGRQRRPGDRRARPDAAGRLRGHLPADGAGHGRRSCGRRSRPSASRRCC